MKKILIILLLLPFLAFSQSEKRYKSIIIDSVKALSGGSVDFKDTSRFEKMVSIGGSLDTSAILTLTDTAKGILIPRMTIAQRDSISSPATGLLIYNNSSTRQRFEFFNGVSWIAISEGVFVKITGDTMTGILRMDGVAIETNTVNESTTDAGVTIDGILLKNGGITFPAASPATIQYDGDILTINSNEGITLQSGDNVTFNTTGLALENGIDIQILDATNTFSGALRGFNITANRIWTFPDAIGTVSLIESAETFSGIKTFSANIVHDSLVIKRECSVIVDDGTIVLPDATTQSLLIWVDGDDEWAQCAIQTDGTVTILTSVGSVVNTDTDTNLCIFDSGTGATIRNRLGSSKTVCFETKYKL